MTMVMGLRGFLWLVVVRFGPRGGQVLPLGIHGNDQRDFLDSQPAFDLLFALDGVAYVVEAFEIHQAVELVLGGEAGADPEFVLARPADETVGDSGVEGFRAVGHDVDEVLFLRARWHKFHTVSATPSQAAASVPKEHRFPQSPVILWQRSPRPRRGLPTKDLCTCWWR